MQYKFIDSETYEDIGESCVTILYKGNEFYGYAKCHPDDEWSEFIGCGYAEIRAQIKALKWELWQKKAACEACRKFVRAVSQYKNFNKEDGTAKAMYRQLNRRIKEVNNIIDEINALELSLKLRKRSQEDLAKRRDKKD